ncbi:CPBP family intramembrane glutamic endopeptidase [Gryllotalpicola koreensis]|uniref:CPBP family intramembrane glutamic endopeptidase n=1 Tax=Gryllotalpicola koreensis TaxID=993086 RepID=UPI0031DA9F16
MALYVGAEIGGLPWPSAPAVAAAAFFMLNIHALQDPKFWVVRPTRPWATWTIISAGAIGAGTMAVALDWRQIRTGYVFPLPIPPEWSVPLLAIGAAVLNTIGEEALWRGMLATLSARVLTLRTATVVQAFSFGLAHYNGIPNGPVGIVAAAVFSAFLYLVSVRVGAVGALVAHFLADLVIFLTVMHFALFAWSG